MTGAPDDRLAIFERLSTTVSSYASPARAIFRYQQAYRGIDLRGKTVLDIGAGRGMASAFAIAQGAKHVVALEPESAGSTDGYSAVILRVQEELNASNFEVRAQPVQDYDNAGRTFDVVLLYQSVNHLDEPMCMALGHSEEARDVYRGIFGRIAGMMNPDARLIMVDASRHNFFPMIGLKNPLLPMIEWEKHQTPRTWVRLLAPLGFVKERVSWHTYHALRHFGPVFANRVVSFVLNSVFRLDLRYPGPPAGQA